MQFTPQETKLIEKLRKQNLLWPRMRWVALGLGVLGCITCAVWGYLLYRGYVLTLDPQSDHISVQGVYGLLFVWTMFGMLFMLGVGQLTAVCFYWHGDVNRMLLVKLLDAQQDQSPTDKHAPNIPDRVDRNDHS